MPVQTSMKLTGSLLGNNEMPLSSLTMLIEEGCDALLLAGKLVTIREKKQGFAGDVMKIHTLVHSD